MRILMINSVCGIRSTGRICTDLAEALEKQGHEVKIGYGRESVPEKYRRFAVRISSEAEVRLHGLKARLFDADGLGSKYATARFLRFIEEFDPDVIHLHNLHGYYINVPMLFRYIIKNNKRVIWTLHDCWAFTGHSGTCDKISCEKWEHGCEHCPLTHGYPKSLLDRSKRNYSWKKELFSSVKDLTLITSSHWLTGLVKRSFLKEKNIVIIPHGVNADAFRYLENDFKQKHGIQEKNMLLGCATAWSKTKGLDDFIALSERLDDRYAVVLVGLKPDLLARMPARILAFGRTQNTEELAKLYSAADIFVNLSYVDSFSMVNREALFCETPVLTYETGGCAECLNGKNGISFKKGDLDAVVHFLNETYQRDMFVCEKINEDALQDPCSMKAAAQKYVNVISGNEKAEG